MSRVDAGQAVRTVRSYLRWMTRAKPGDYLIALSAVSASTPVIGRHIQPISGMAALGVCGRTYLPGIVSSMASARFDPGGHQLRREQLALTPTVLTEALQGIVERRRPRTSVAVTSAAGAAVEGGRAAPVCAPVVGALRRSPQPGSRRLAKPGHPGAPAPVLVYIPGGAWVFGSRTLQGHALMAHLVRRGWVCLSLEYRTSPQHRWPRQMTDVKAAIAWARANVAEFGGDPEFIVAAGCSAGGHLATLAGLTANDPQWQTELPADADTSVDAVVSLYGLYDWQDRSTVQRAPIHGIPRTRRRQALAGPPPRDVSTRLHRWVGSTRRRHRFSSCTAAATASSLSAKRARSSTSCDRCRPRPSATSSCQVSVTDST